MNTGTLSIIVILTGRIENSINEIGYIVDELMQVQKSVKKILFVADGKKWESVPLYQMLAYMFSNVTCITLESETNIPALLYNTGIQNADSDYLAFYDLQTKDIPERVELFEKYCEETSREDLLYIRTDFESPVYPSIQNRYGFLQIENYYQLDDIFARSELIRKKGAFNISPLLQEEFAREFLLRMSADIEFTEIGGLQGTSKKASFPAVRFKIPKNIIERYVLRCCRIAHRNQNSDKIEQGFVNDLKESEYLKIKDYLQCKPDDKVLYHKKYKILILGGYWEYHHNQVCFMNYLESLAGKGFATFKTGFDFKTTAEDLYDNDLVIFSRCRSNNALRLMDYCRSHSIPTIYMIDDNWMSIAKDYPDQGAIFVPGNPNYDNFLEALGKCTTVWYFNDKIREDIKGYADHFTKFRISVEPLLFECKEKRQRDNILYIGFSGSLRFDDTAFKALARIANTYSNVKVILAGIVSPEQEQLFSEESIIRMNFTSYSRYAKEMGCISPDLLIAPLSNTRTSASKCYNKYVESGILHAACVFSKVEPYTQVVRDGQNGYFVEDETEDAWYEKLSSIISNIDKLRQVQENVYNDVLENHTVQAILPDFVKKISDVIEGRLA